MGVVAFANNQVLVSEYGNSMEITTDPYPTRGINYGEAVLNVHSIVAVVGAAPLLTYTVQGSNDSQSWFDVGTFTDNSGLVGSYEKGEDITCAFIRLKFSFAVGGTGGDWGYCAFDLHMNLIHK